MSELPVHPGLVGSEVQNAARPEWGVGKVLRVQPVRVGGKAAHRVSIQFAVGHRTLLVPPARLRSPQPEPQRESGWLAGLGKRTLDDRLRALPEEAVQILGTPLERLAAAIPLYGVTEDSDSLLRWARAQIGVADPLAHWSRDELLEALHDFCTERDAYLRSIAAIVKQSEGAEVLRGALEAIPQPLREAVLTALRRPI